VVRRPSVSDRGFYPGAVRIAPDDPYAPDVRALIEVHLVFSYEHSPPEDVHALPIDGLADPSVSFYACRGDDDVLLGVGALKQIDDRHAELKSMHTVSAWRGRGIGAAMLEFLLAEAAARGCERVSLETGTMASYAPARRLYARAGFRPCPPYGEYTDSPHSMCMTLEIPR
jgi:putative acetyltransferase